MRRPKVIVVDDDGDLRRLLRTVLEESGFDVGEAPNGLRLISLLHVNRPDVILLDVMMSWISGFDLCRSIRSNPMYAGMHVCILSGHCRDSDAVRRGLEAGADAYLFKPVEWGQLIHTLKRLTGVGVRSGAGLIGPIDARRGEAGAASIGAR